MTAHPAPSAQPSVGADRPSGRRLLGAAVVGSLGAIAFSIAFGGYVAATRTALPPQAAADAQALAGWLPAIVAVGVAHFLVAAAMIRGRDVLRITAAGLTGIAALAAATAAVMIVAGVDPLGRSGASHPSTAGIGILAITAALYGVAALAAGSSSAD